MNPHLKTARFLADLLDNKFEIAGFHFGLDPIIGLIPFVGDLVTTIFSFYIVWIGMQMKLPPDKISQMIANVVFDFLLDFIPVIGQAADFVWKANSKNMEILEDFAKKGNVHEGQVV
jgi:hypothetical protein